MTVGTIEVFRLPASLVTGDYPVFSSPSATLSSYLTTSFSNAKFTKDFQQRIVLAEFDGWQSANMVRLTSGSWVAWYWITDRSAQTGINSAIEYAIEYNPVSSLLTSSSSVTGYWTRTPTNISPWKQQAVMSGAMEPSTIHNFNNSIVTGAISTETGLYASFQLFWVQVTATENLSSSGTPTADRLTTYGFPIAYRYLDNSTYNGAYVTTTIYNNSDSSYTEGTTKRFPTLTEMMSNATVFGLSSASVITDISVSPILPFDYRSWTSTTTYPVFCLYNSGGVLTEATITSGTIAVYKIEGSGSTYWQTAFRTTQVLTVTEKEAMCGQITIRDPQGSDIAQIPIQWLTKSGSSYSLNFTARCITDFGQMTIKVDIGDNTYQIPTIHVPYIGTQWDSYVAYSQAYDRESVESNISYARDALNIQTNASIANGVIGAIGSALSGNIGGAFSSLLGTGIQTATNYRLQDISDSQARYQQDLTERRIQAQPATVYSVSYGITYLKACMDRLPCFVVSIPSGLTDEIFNAYVERYGYSAEGKATLSIDTGYYQGQILPTTTISGGEYDRLNETFMRGIHITEV